MSIWCSWQSIGMSGWLQLEEEWEGGEVRSYADGWSNHYPDGEAEFPAEIHLASIPTWCVPGHSQEEGPDDRPYGPWLRVGIYSPRAKTWWRKTKKGKPKRDPKAVMVVIDEQAAQTLRDQLNDWLNAPKVHPMEQAEREG